MSGSYKKNRTLILTVILAAAVMVFVDGVVQPQYLYKSLFKILLFLVLPLSYFLVHRDQMCELKKLFIPKKKGFLMALLLGIGVYTVILGGYFLFKDYIDFSGIQESLTKGIGVTKDNFIWVSLYIAFINSLLEEFFFRGYAFLLLKKQAGRTMAYVFSAGMFAFYHAGMIHGWFQIWIHILSMLGLFIGGCIFNFLNEKCENIYPSWLLHMFANFAINTVGFILFGLI